MLKTCSLPTPQALWEADNPDPDLWELVVRWAEVDAALACAAAVANVTPPVLLPGWRWRAELGLTDGLLWGRSRRDRFRTFYREGK